MTEANWRSLPTVTRNFAFKKEVHDKAASTTTVVRAPHWAGKDLQEILPE
jgi:hypothetical protein